jgi:hypothetical protein
MGGGREDNKPDVTFLNVLLVKPGSTNLGEINDVLKTGKF